MGAKNQPHKLGMLVWEGKHFYHPLLGTSAGLVAQADEAEAHMLAGSPPLFVFPGSLMLGTGSWDSCALSADILGRVVFRGVTSSNVKLLSIFESSTDLYLWYFYKSRNS